MDLSGKILIAMPAMGDTRFEKSVILICSHSAEGAMGLILNKPLPGLKFSELLRQLKFTEEGSARPVPVQFGGPVETGRGFVLHSDDWRDPDGTMPVEGGYGLTTTHSVLSELAAGRGPQQALMLLGYAGWGEGQLEGEIARSDWLVGEAAPDLIFSAADAGKWTRALAAMGIDPLVLSASGGRA
ncbi:YqgE/AlgH family protein [Falsigemmobacter intermedius]|uniref:UPF0301 protein EP867_01080 n=1 Tax=Falsigemmobacter intermedius TaxID=1553448 RepID=A0A444MH33_9RHOB|nr:YqgE/AlgH family protein [Falsigemmobacter intermedius]RWY45639.1 YqgE/AlgH family protein [Falsigemmobacter intermedius]